MDPPDANKGLRAHGDWRLYIPLHHHCEDSWSVCRSNPGRSGQGITIGMLEKKEILKGRKKGRNENVCQPLVSPLASDAAYLGGKDRMAD
uniref:Uncharacterized protein n=1 Tax=Oryza brachyantha TaxID=4533 RepID=J3M5T9_ORYBR